MNGFETGVPRRREGGEGGISPSRPSLLRGTPPFRSGLFSVTGHVYPHFIWFGGKPAMDRAGKDAGGPRNAEFRRNPVLLQGKGPTRLGLARKDAEYQASV